VYCLQPDSNNSTSPYYNLKVRQAVAYSLDTTAITKAVGYGIYIPTNQLAVSGGYMYNSAIAGYPYNVSKAQQLLKDAGITTPLNTTITFQTGSEYQDTSTAVQAYLQAIGINAKLDPAEQSRFITLYSGNWTNDLLFPQSIANSLGSDPARGMNTNLAAAGTRYKAILFPADYTALLAKATPEPNDTLRRQEFQQVNLMAIDTYCLTIPIYEQFFVSLYDSTKVHNFTMNAVAPGVWYPQNVWLSQ
jgi:peptide/nickel transport system substrate-binding protein